MNKNLILCTSKCKFISTSYQIVCGMTITIFHLTNKQGGTILFDI